MTELNGWDINYLAGFHVGRNGLFSCWWVVQVGKHDSPSERWDLPMPGLTHCLELCIEGEKDGEEEQEAEATQLHVAG